MGWLILFLYLLVGVGFIRAASPYIEKEFDDMLEHDPELNELDRKPILFYSTVLGVILWPVLLLVLLTNKEK